MLLLNLLFVVTFLSLFASGGGELKRLPSPPFFHLCIYPFCTPLGLPPLPILPHPSVGALFFSPFSCRSTEREG